ncbi:MAG: NADH-ubiquinone oxidoreductase-F iron-sulfur binding region domain-containing protein [Acidimicrobiales bacterium]
MDQSLVLPDRNVSSYAHHREARGGDALAVSSTLGADGILSIIETADLRGRGGAWFPTATKWRTTRRFAGADTTPTLVVNAAEGEPGSFKDRWLLRRDPYSVIEGAVIAAGVIGADTVVFAVKRRARTEIASLQAALRSVRSTTTVPMPAFEVVEGPDRYLFGEESALLEVVAGRPPFPRLSPPWRHGALDLGSRGAPASTALSGEGRTEGMEDGGQLPPPALVQNVETLARAAHIVRQPDSPGMVARTFLATVSGDVERTRVVEIPIGVSMRDVLGDDADAAAAVLNGVTYPIIDPDRFDLPLLPGGEPDESIPIGAGAFQAFSAATDPRSIAAAAARFLSTESCGQCEPCKSDGLAISEILVDLANPDGGAGDHAADAAAALARRAGTVTEGARCGLAAQQRDVVEGLLAYFPDALARTGSGPGVPLRLAPLLDIVDGRAVFDTEHGDVQPDWRTTPVWSGRYPAAVEDVAQEASR